MRNILLVIIILVMPKISLAAIVDDYNKYVNSLAYCLNVQTVFWGAALLSLNEFEKSSEEYRALKNITETANPKELNELFNTLVPKESDRDRLYNIYTDEVTSYTFQELIPKSRDCSVMSAILKQ